MRRGVDSDGFLQSHDFPGSGVEKGDWLRATIDAKPAENVPVRCLFPFSGSRILWPARTNLLAGHLQALGDVGMLLDQVGLLGAVFREVGQVVGLLERTAAW